ncbi:MAG: OmpA family protein [Myxococcales bacterium]|nr:OmpA family protein [Myxococcales bacterium]
MNAPASKARGSLLAALAVLFVVTVARPGLARADRLEQQSHLIELGGFIGLMVPSTEHELYNRLVGHYRYGTVTFDTGFRLAYMPFFFLGAEIELAVMPTEANDVAVMLHGFRAHVLGQFPIGGRFAPFLLIGGGYLGVVSGASSTGGDVDPAFHWGWGAKLYLRSDLALRIDFRQNVSARLGSGSTSHWEVLFGASWVLNWVTDTDKDGVPDNKDRCPKIAARTSDGCPAVDSDGDGIIDQLDKCPTQPATGNDGCPIRDHDWDGIPDHLDKCPTQPETRNGYQDEDGCPDVAPVPKGFEGTLEGVTFASGKARIAIVSYPVLDRAAKVLLKHVGLRVLIRGHTDSRGNRARNVRLSKDRAEAVKRYLIKKGISASRLTVQGVGPDEPVGDNKTAEGRAKNRRIEFKVVKTSGGASTPDTPAPQLQKTPTKAGAKKAKKKAKRKKGRAKKAKKKKAAKGATPPAPKPRQRTDVEKIP